MDTLTYKSVVIFILCIVFVNCKWDALGVSQHMAYGNVGPVVVAGDASGNWLAAYTYYSSINQEIPSFNYYRWDWGQNDWMPDNETVPPYVITQCQLPEFSYMITMDMASGSIDYFVVTFIATYNKDPCYCVIAAITKDTGNTWEWHTWPWCSLFPTTNSTSNSGPNNDSNIYYRPAICAPDLPPFPPNPSLANLDMFVTVEVDENDNILLVVTDVRPFYTPTHTSNLMISLYSNSKFSIQYQNSSKNSYGNPIVVSGGSGIWLIAGYLAYQNDTEITNLVSSFYTLYKVEGAPWEEFPYHIYPILLQGVDIVTNKNGVWVACYTSHPLSEIFTQHIMCQTIQALDNSTPPFFDPYGEGTNIVTIESFYLYPCLEMDYSLRHDKDFLDWIDETIIVVYQFMGAYYSYSTDEGNSWILSSLDTSTSLVPISTQYPISYGLFIVGDGYSRFAAGYISCQSHWTDDFDLVYYGVILSTFLTDNCKQNLSFCDPATTICRNGLQPQSTELCYCKPNLVSLTRYSCIDPNDPCVAMKCEQICWSDSDKNARCYCYAGYSSIDGSQNHTIQCNRTTPWTIEEGLSQGPDIPYPTAAVFSTTGLIYLIGESSIRAENLNRVYQYVVPTNRWSGSTLDYNDQITPGVYNNPALCPFALSLWILGGVTSTSNHFDIWELDILLESVVKYTLDLSEIPNNYIPNLQKASCLVHSSGKNFEIFLYGGYYDNYVVSNTVYEFLLFPNATGIAKAYTNNDPMSVWPPPLYNSMFVSLTSFILNEKANVLVGGRLNQGANGSLTADMGPFIYNYLGMGEWEVVNIDDRFHCLPSQGRSYITTFDSNIISVFDLETPGNIFALSQFEELKIYEDGNVYPFWAAVCVWPGGDYSSIMKTWQPFFMSFVDKSADDVSLVLFSRETNITGIRVYTIDPNSMDIIDTCAQGMSLCVEPAYCKNSVSYSYDCVCPSGYYLNPDGRSCQERDNFTKIIIIACVCGGVFLLIAAVLIWHFSRRIDLSSLPEELSWPFKYYYNSEGRGWKKQGSGSTRFYSRELPENSNSYERVLELFEKKLGGSRKEGTIKCNIIYSIFNPTLLTAFLTFRSVVESRFKTDEKIFRKQIWNNKKDPFLEQRNFVYRKYEELMSQFNWNNEETMKSGMAILPALHGTGMDVAWKVAEKGFAGISSLDGGFYGKGVYFTTHALYALPYFAANPKPALIIAYTFPGNVYPVIESHTGPNSLLGKGLVGSSTAHYVLTKVDGSISSMDDKNIFDELVIGQENATLPVFILEIDKTNLLPLINRFKRAVPSEKSSTFVELREDYQQDSEEITEIEVRRDSLRSQKSPDESDPNYQLFQK